MWNDTDDDAVVNVTVENYKLVEVSTIGNTQIEMLEVLQPQQIAVALYEKT
jgi:hypothetical protein